jgi:chorismate synthase
MTLRYLSAGESHGPSLTGVLEGMPANLPIDLAAINHQLARRQRGHGRGGRMAIEQDRVEVTAGLRFSLTTGGPLAFLLENRDFANWREAMAAEGTPPAGLKPVTRPRPGHADLAGGLKYGQQDLRNILERASARETAMRVVVGSAARQLLREFGLHIYSHVVAIGGIRGSVDSLPHAEIEGRAEASPVRSADLEREQEMMERIDRAREEGDSLGGIIEVVALSVPVGLGSHVQADRRLDGRLAQAFMSIQAVKGVEIGCGFAGADLTGSKVHDEIFYSEEKGYYRQSNRAGGIEGGISNGSPIIIRAALKPIPTLYKPLQSVDMGTRQPYTASVERSDTCAVPAAAVVGEAVLAFELAKAFLDKFGGDSLEEVRQNYQAYMQGIQAR